ncbi:MAG: hypothetical protein U0V75_00200 [Ferruginibacter sp.]
MDMYDQYIEDYVCGFNHAALLAEYAPEALSEIEQGSIANDDYLEGFFAGREFYQMEQEHHYELAQLESIRESSRDREFDLDLEIE